MRNTWKSHVNFEQQLALVSKQDLLSLRHCANINNYVNLCMENKDSPLRIIDYGCGVGHMSSFLATEERPNIQYVGVDFAEQAIKLARIYYAYRNVKFHVVRDDAIVTQEIYGIPLFTTDLALYSGVLNTAGQNFVGILDAALQKYNNNVIIARQGITDDESYVLDYKAYGANLKEYVCNKADFLSVISKNSYQIIECDDHSEDSCGSVHQDFLIRKML